MRAALRDAKRAEAKALGEVKRAEAEAKRAAARARLTALGIEWQPRNLVHVVPRPMRRFYPKGR